MKYRVRPMSVADAVQEALDPSTSAERLLELWKWVEPTAVFARLRSRTDQSLRMEPASGHMVDELGLVGAFPLPWDVDTGHPGTVLQARPCITNFRYRNQQQRSNCQRHEKGHMMKETVSAPCWFCRREQTMPNPGGSNPKSFLWRKRAARECACRTEHEIRTERILHSPPDIPFDKLDGADETRAWLSELWLPDRARVVYIEVSRVLGPGGDNPFHIPTPQQLTYWLEREDATAVGAVDVLCERTGLTQWELLDLHQYGHENAHG